MSRRILALGTLPLFLLFATTACSDALGPSSSGASLRRGADDPPGDNRGVDLPGDDKGVDARPHFRRGADDPTGIDLPKAGGADDPVNHS